MLLLRATFVLIWSLLFDYVTPYRSLLGLRCCCCILRYRYRVPVYIAVTIAFGDGAVRFVRSTLRCCYYPFTLRCAFYLPDVAVFTFTVVRCCLRLVGFVVAVCCTTFLRLFARSVVRLLRVVYLPRCAVLFTVAFIVRYVWTFTDYVSVVVTFGCLLYVAFCCCCCCSDCCCSLR